MEYTHGRSCYKVLGEKRDGTVLTLSDLMWEPDVGWREAAACSGVESDTFFPASEEESAAAAAKRICAECPVSEACLQYALVTNQAAGVWGGLDSGERRRMRRRLRDRERRKAS
ncbi:MAG: WhiB family transcriptional regulator [Acidimicrobiia bacterium]